MGKDNFPFIFGVFGGDTDRDGYRFAARTPFIIRMVLLSNIGTWQSNTHAASGLTDHRLHLWSAL